jgi:hypothetical protein
MKKYEFHKEEYIFVPNSSAGNSQDQEIFQSKKPKTSEWQFYQYNTHNLISSKIPNISCIVRYAQSIYLA